MTCSLDQSTNMLKEQTLKILTSKSIYKTNQRYHGRRDATNLLNKHTGDHENTTISPIKSKLEKSLTKSRQFPLFGWHDVDLASNIAASIRTPSFTFIHK